MVASFRQGDLIRAAVAALGGARSYELSTARDELGVVHALSAETDEPLVPTGWTTMVRPSTGQEETRKVARTAA